MADGQLPFSNFSHLHEEQETKKLKGFVSTQDYSGVYFTENISKIDDLVDKETG